MSGAPLTRVAKVNMEIVSLMSEATRISMLKPDDQRGLAAPGRLSHLRGNLAETWGVRALSRWERGLRGEGEESRHSPLDEPLPPRQIDDELRAPQERRGVSRIASSADIKAGRYLRRTTLCMCPTGSALAK